VSYHCTKCNKELEKQQSYEYQGNPFCEDCYMDILSPPRACDPWAVRSAQTFLKGRDKFSTLPPLQREIVDYIGGKQEATMEELIESLKLTEKEIRGEFAVLRHMEVLRAIRKDGKVVYVYAPTKKATSACRNPYGKRAAKRWHSDGQARALAMISITNHLSLQ